MKIPIKPLSLIALSVLLACDPGAGDRQSTEFKKTLDKHFAAIQSQDLEKLLSTVSDSVILILPNGDMIASKESYSNFHVTWFNDPNWTLQPTVINTITSGDLSHALTRYWYSELDSSGRIITSRSTYLQLVFKKFPKGWLLVLDQNTRIENTSN